MPSLGQPAAVCATALAATVLLTGCTGQQATPSARDAAQGAASPDPAAELPAPPQPPVTVEGPTDEDEELPPAEPYPTWDAQAREQAVQAATAAMTAFARPQLDATRWWAELSPLLTPAAAVAYQGTDPAEVPARAVTAPGALVDDTSTYLAGVQVPTDAGPYLVLLSRDGAGAPWLVERLTPPAAAGRP